MTERGADGLLTLTAHASMPGVLIRVETADRGNGLVVVVRSVEGAPWERVRSGDPVRLLRSGGVYAGHAFDLAAVPGKRTTYAVLDATGAVDERRAVSILLPALGDCEAWAKHAVAPWLSQRVRLIRDGSGRAVEGWTSQAGVFGARRPHLTHAGVASVAYPLTLCVHGDAAVHLARALVETPGPILLQSSQAHGLDEAWLAWTDERIGEDRLDSTDWDHRHITVPMVEVDAPATLDAPLLVPPGSHAGQSRAARSWAEYAARYPSGGDALLAAIGADRGGDA